MLNLASMMTGRWPLLHILQGVKKHFGGHDAITVAADELCYSLTLPTGRVAMWQDGRWQVTTRHFQSSGHLLDPEVMSQIIGYLQVEGSVVALDFQGKERLV